ncbi:tetratricopeptide repeat protein [Brumimicrobium oceani]|uniref:Uncharacterized protein n=1 Tax=Brumimicrobium oceani TaxID=2100725 RepID=A0A2U2XGE2_9FLAO|nr:hypothetical protein [Brumimicrobium oceani]PWH86879.1 hypothetical protein DIT68_01060 [Brumimicrobium oceani]
MIYLNLLNRIFGPKEPLTRQEIDDYKSKTGNAHDIESKASDSGFNNLGLEGWKKSTSSVSSGMSQLDKKMDQFVNNNAPKAPSKNGMTFTFVLFTLTMLALIFFTYQGNTAVEKKPLIVEENKEIDSRSKEIDVYTTISPDKQITSKELIKNREIKTLEQNNETTQKKELKPASDELKTNDAEEEIQLPIQSSGRIATPQSQGRNKNSLVYKEAQEVYLFDLKNVDYRSYRNRPIKVINSLEIGTPANQSSKDDQQDFQAVQTREITYIDYLSKSSAFFSKGQFKIALKHYLKILDTYPKDVNANFYGGLCYFNLGQFDKATALLSKSYSLGYGNFREEAKWFTARAEIEEKHVLKAKHLLEEIIEEGGFYKERAMKELKTLGI